MDWTDWDEALSDDAPPLPDLREADLAGEAA